MTDYAEQMGCAITTGYESMIWILQDQRTVLHGRLMTEMVHSQRGHQLEQALKSLDATLGLLRRIEAR